MKEVMCRDGELLLWRVATLDLIPVLPLTGSVPLESDLVSLRFAFLIYKVKLYCGDQKWLRHYNTGHRRGLLVSAVLDLGTEFRFQLSLCLTFTNS